MQSVEREQSSSSSSAHDPAARRHRHPDSYHTTEEEEPSVDVLQQPSFQYHASLHPIDTITTPTTPSHVLPTIDSSHSAGTTTISPFFSAGLRLQTDAPVNNYQPGHTSPSTSAVPFAGASLQDSGSKTDIPVRSSSIRSALSATAHHRRGSLSPASVISSPGFDPAVDVTPLPSPITSWGSPGQWRRVREKQGLQDRISDPPRDTATAMTSSQGSSGFSLLAQEGKKPQISHVPSSVDKRDAQGYGVNADAHARNQGVGNDISNHVQVPGCQNMDFSSPRADLDEGNVSSPTKHLHREEYLAVKRGLALPMPKPLTPPRSNRNTEDSDLGSPPTSPSAPKRTPIFHEARTIRSGKLKRWREIGYLGGGAFSTVILATSEGVINNNKSLAQSIDVFSSPAEVSQLDPKRLVAIKICEHGPAGGADEKRVEMSLERELDILKSIDHPSLAHLKAVNIMDQRAFLVLSYCPGGDLYFLAESKTELLIPSLVRRIFAELVAAARHLHSQYIVHRDIKLESPFSVFYPPIRSFETTIDLPFPR